MCAYKEAGKNSSEPLTAFYMDAFLEKTREKLLNLETYNNLTIVIGNESCDLDSAVSALILAFFHFWRNKSLRHETCADCDVFMPILNVKRTDIELKTEIMYCFKKNGVDISKLFYRDDFDLQGLIGKASNPSVLLVDHHVLSKQEQFLAPYVQEVIDHRPKDKDNWKFKPDTSCSIELVGSCSTLVCDRIREASLTMGDEAAFFTEAPVTAHLIHSTIILDTVNFSKEVKKGTPKDENMVSFLERILNVENITDYRKSKLSTLVEARMNVSSLSVAQLIRKDLKIFGDVMVPSLPILVEELLTKPNAAADIESSLSNTGCNIILLLGMKLNTQDVQRDAALYAKDGVEDRMEELKRLLEDWKKPVFELVSTKCDIPKCIYYKQLNKAASRKQYVPVVNEFFNKH